MSSRKKNSRPRRAPARPPEGKGEKGQSKPVTRFKSAGTWFEKLVALQARLRAPDGCPWDREQTHSSLRTFLLEETYEVLEALDARDDAKLAEELGDLLLQVVFHAEIAREEKRFDVADVIREIHDKMVRRHPHVFGEARARDAAEVLKNWEQLKTAERRAKREKAGEAEPPATTKETLKSLLEGIPRSLPATLEGFQLTRRAARIGFDWDRAEEILDKLREESAELRHSLQAKEADKTEEEVGDLLFAAVNLARFLEVDPEIALKKANYKFSLRFRAMERMARESGRALASVPREEMERLWDEAKRAEREKGRAEVATERRR